MGQLYAYTRPDGVTGFGFQINVGPEVNKRIHHSISWPDKPCERYSEAMLKNRMIACAEAARPSFGEAEPEPAEGEVVADPVTSEDVESEPLQMASGSEPNPVELVPDPAVDPVMPSEPQSDTPETPPVQVAAQPTVTKQASPVSQEMEVVDPPRVQEAAAQPTAPSPIEPVDLEPAASVSDVHGTVQNPPPSKHFPLDDVQLNPADSEATKVLTMLKAVPTATSLEVIQAMNMRGIEVSLEFVEEQRKVLQAVSPATAAATPDPAPEVVADPEPPAAS